jgi:hypothetical protein
VFRGAVVFTRQQLHCPTAATLFGQLLSQQGWAIQIWVLPQSQETSLEIHTIPFWEVDLSPHPYSQPLCLPSPLLGASWAPLGGWFVTPPQLSVFVTFPAFVHWEFGSLPQPHSLVLDCNSLFMLFSFVGGGEFNLPRCCAGLCSQEIGRRVSCGSCCSPVCSAGLCKQFWNWPVGRNGMLLFSVWWGIGRVSMD